MNDKLGIPLSVGDRVIYATTGEQGNQLLEIGTVLEFKLSKYSSSLSVQLLSVNGRKLSNLRRPSAVLSIEPIYKAHPEILI